MVHSPTKFVVPLTFLCTFATALLGPIVPMAYAGALKLTPAPGRNYVQTADFDAGHLQGIATNGIDAIFWSFTDKLVKTDTAGNTLYAVDVIDHHGDLTYAVTSTGQRSVFVAVNDRESPNPGQFNVLHPNNPPRQWIYEYDADNLALKNQYSVKEVLYGAGGVAFHDGKFLVVGGQPGSETKNYVYEYDQSFQFVKMYALETGNTDRGIQTAEFGAGHWWFGTYLVQDGVRQLLKFDQSLPLDQFEQFSFSASYGIAALENGQFLIATTHSRDNGDIFGRVHLAVPDSTAGMKIIQIPVPEPKGFTQIGIALVALAIFACFRHRRRIRPEADGVFHTHTGQFAPVHSSTAKEI